MKRLLAVLAVATAGLLSLPALASAGNDVARGNGVSPFFPSDFSFNAQSNFNGTQPSGSVTFTDPDRDPNLTFKGRVTCLNVVLNDATISGEITDVSGGDAGFFSTTRSFVIHAVDSGKFATGPDLVSYVTSSALPPPPPSCAAFVLTPFPIFSGEITVKDANS